MKNRIFISLCVVIAGCNSTNKTPIKISNLKDTYNFRDTITVVLENTGDSTILYSAGMCVYYNGDKHCSDIINDLTHPRAEGGFIRELKAKDTSHINVPTASLSDQLTSASSNCKIYVSTYKKIGDPEAQTRIESEAFYIKK